MTARGRAERELGLSPQVPEPQADPLYEDLDPEGGDKMPLPSQPQASERCDAVSTRRIATWRR